MWMCDFGNDGQIAVIVVARACEQPQKHFAATIPDFEVTTLEPYEAPAFFFDDLNDSAFHTQAHGVRGVAMALSAFVGDRYFELGPGVDRASCCRCRRRPVTECFHRELPWIV